MKTILTAVVGLVVGILGTTAVQHSAERTLSAALDYAATKLERAAQHTRDARANGTEYQPNTDVSKPTIGKLDDRVKKIVDLADELTPHAIALTNGDSKNDKVKMISFVQKAGGQGKNEYVDLEVLQPIDLSNGKIGDSKRSPESADAISLPADLKLSAGERVRIFTTENYERIVKLHQG